MKLDWIGWIATALFASSYFFKQPMALRKVQALAALLWVVYGLMIHALPVVVANVVVAIVALLVGVSSIVTVMRIGDSGAHSVWGRGS